MSARNISAARSASGYLFSICTIALIVSCSWIVGQPTKFWGTASLNYDDSEYVYQAIDTTDRLNQAGLLSWPEIVYSHQHYGKPPLFVNTLAGAIELTGRERVMGGVRLTLILSTLSLLAAVALVFTRIYGPAGGLLAVLSTMALPAFISWAPRVVPDIQVAFLAFAAIAVLISTHRGPLTPVSSVLLGMLWGLGMHSKATYPLYALGPLLAWVLYDRSLSRMLSLVPAIAVGLLITAIWYLPNFEEAIQYVRGAADFIDDPGMSRRSRLGQWLTTLTIDGFGWIPGCLVLLAAAIHIFPGWRRTGSQSDAHVLLSLSLAAAALPMLLVALSSSAPPNTRHPLPSLILVALLAAAILSNHFHQAKRGLLYRNACISLLLLQAIIFLGAIQKSDQPLGAGEPLRYASKLLAPGFIAQQAIDDTLPLLAFSAATTTLGDEPAIVYLAGHDGSLHVPKLNLLAILNNSALRFDYATYFSWTAAECETRTKKLIADGETFLFLENKQADATGASRYFNRHMPLAKALMEKQAADDYSASTLADNPNRKLQILLPNRRLNLPELPSRQLGVSFADRITVASVARTEGYIVVRLKTTGKIDKNYKLMLHVSQAQDPQHIAVLDQYIMPPLSIWKPGSTRNIFIKLPVALSQPDLQVRIGFFDEGDAAHDWPRLQTSDGQDSLIISLPVSLGDMVSPATVIDGARQPHSLSSRP